MKLFQTLTCLFGLALATLPVSASRPFAPEQPDPVLEPWRWKSFSELKGKGLRCLAQDKDGHMWFGVDDGVRHYDGLNWTLFTPEDGLLGTPVNVLCTASNGDVYAGSDEGISVFRGEKWERLFPRRGNYAWPVDGILETSTGELWAATGWGALHMVKGEVTLHTSLQMAEAIQVLYPDVEVVIVPEEAVPVHKWTDGTGVRVVKGAYLGIDRSEKETPIWALAPGGPGERIGLKPGDMVYEFDEHVLDLPHLVLDGFEGAPVKLAIRRKGVEAPFEIEVEREHLSGTHSGFSLSDVLEDREGRIWFGVSWFGEIVSYSPGASHPWTLFDADDGLGLGGRPILAQSPDGTLWSASAQARIGVNRFDGKRWSHELLGTLTQAMNVHHSIVVTQDGTVWVGGYGGTLFRYQNGDWLVHRPPVLPLSSTRVGGMLETSDGALWFASLGQEASRLEYGTTRWSSYGELEFQCEATDGSIWFKHRKQVVRYLPGSGSRVGVWTQYGLEDGLMDTHLLIRATRSGPVWISGSHKGIAAAAEFREERWHLHMHPEIAQGFDRRGLFEASDGSIWIASAVSRDPELGSGQEGGMLQYDGHKWIHHRPPQAPRFAYGIGQSTDGVLWLGGGRLNRFDGENWSVPSALPGLKSWVQSIHGSATSGLWVGTRAYGIFRNDGRKWTQYAVDEGLANNTIVSITEGVDGTIWASTDKGISRFDGQSWTTHALLPELRDHVTSLNHTRDGSIWYSSRLGTIRYEPEIEPPETWMDLELEEVSQPGNTTLLWKGSDRWGVTPQAEVQYSWRLNGGAWSAYSTETNKVFFSLPDGGHLFEVKSRDRDFNEDPTPARLEFRVIPPVWRQAWFVVLMGGLVVVIGVQTGRVVWRDQRLRRSNEELRKDRAMEGVRAGVTAMKTAEDLRVVVVEMLAELAQLGVEFDLCVINIVDEQAGVRRQYSAYQQGWAGQSEIALTDVPDDFMDIYRGDTPVVRTVDDDLANRHAQTEGYLGGEGERPTEIVDAPFAYGTLSLSTRREDGFTPQDVNLVGDFARVLELGYTRFMDFQQLEEQNRALEEANVQIQEATRLKSQFLANMSHELRTPLNAILGFSQLMQRDQGLTEGHKENLSVIGRSGEHLLTLINDVLEMSKIEAGQTTLDEFDFDLFRLLDGLEEMLRLRAENKGLNLVFERPDEIPRYVHADEGKLRQILINLLGNAIKFTSEGKVAMRTRYKRDLSTHRLFFEVEDTGLGIGEDELENLFEAFGQTSSGRNSQEGTGLGLAISQEYVRLMDGEVTVSSQSGKGSVFSFDVRIELGDDSQVDQSQLSRKVVGLAPDQPVYRILVVEDKWENRKLLVKLLEPLGFQVREAENGQEGVRMWKEWEPQLIWMDMRMPVMDGYEATREIKDSQKGKDTVIIALTASAFEENRKVILSSGCDGFIRKPFRESELFDAMVEHLGVSFDYEEAGDPEEESTGLRETLGSDAFDHLTVDWITRLQSAATQADAELIANLTGELADEDSRLGEVLTNMVHDFRFDDIIALTGRQ